MKINEKELNCWVPKEHTVGCIELTSTVSNRLKMRIETTSVVSNRLVSKKTGNRSNFCQRLNVTEYNQPVSLF